MAYPTILFGAVLCARCFLGVSSGSVPCRKIFHAQLGEKQAIAVHGSDPTRPNPLYCLVEIYAPPRNLIRLTISGMSGMASDAGCSDSYIHVGNHGKMLDKAGVTSDKFCGEVDEEQVVSRANYMWVVLSFSTLDRLPDLYIYFEVLPVAQCDRHSSFRCSPVECVPKLAVCDGVADCHNRRDEYCGPFDSQNKPCFRCMDGQCVLPWLDRFDDLYGKKLWFLCDGYDHCIDGTDERRHMCATLRGRRESVVECVPLAGGDGHQTALFWKTVMCDGNRDCLRAEDENEAICSPQPLPDNKVMDATPVVVVCCSVFTLALGVCAVRRIDRWRQKWEEPPEEESAEVTGTTYDFHDYKREGELRMFVTTV